MTALLITAAVCIQGLSWLTIGMVSPENEVTQPSDMFQVNLKSNMPKTAMPGRWLVSFEEASALAASQNVPLIVHFEASWCGPCRTMEASVLNQAAVHDQLARQFVGVRVDADHHPDLVTRFKISSLPTEVVISNSGDELARYVGITNLNSYVARLNSLAGRENQVASSDDKSEASSPEDDDKTRSCLIVRRDGKMVGLGGFSPVALIAGRVWERGNEEFVGSYETVDYFFRSADERDLFLKSPENYIPRLHGCDPVSLYMKNRAEAGAIEFGAFYKGQLYFFASVQNRERFQRNPDWYAGGMQRDYVDNAEQFPFLKSTVLE